jgi:hypothetical protein
MTNTYEIRTIHDILKVVNQENKDCFLTDFSNWLSIQLLLQEQLKGLDIEVKLSEYFNWIDDGKNTINLSFKINEEPKKAEVGE